MLVLLFCVIRGTVLMSENPVNPVIHGPLWATKTKTALNDCKIKVEAREKTGYQCTLYKEYISM